MLRTKTILLVGGSGFVGTHLALALRENYRVITTHYRHPSRIPGTTSLPMEASNRNWVRRIIYSTRPDVIIYAAGTIEPWIAEEDSRPVDIAMTSGPAMVLSAAEILAPKFILLSNCFAFDGHRGNYHETDTVLPSTALGKSTVGGENFLRGKAIHHVIVRSSPLFGRGNGTRITWFDRLRIALGRGERIELPDDALHSFAPVEGFAAFIARLIETGPRNRPLHYGGLSKVTHLEFGKAFAKHFGFNPDLVQKGKPGVPILNMGHSTTTHETMDFSLNSTAACEALKLEPFLLEEGFDLIEKQLIGRA